MVRTIPLLHSSKQEKNISVVILVNSLSLKGLKNMAFNLFILLKAIEISYKLLNHVNSFWLTYLYTCIKQSYVNICQIVSETSQYAEC